MTRTFTATQTNLKAHCKAQGMPLFHLGWTAGALWQSSDCSSCNNGQDTRLFAFCERHQNRIAINEQRLMQAPSGLYRPERLCDATNKQCKTIYLNTNPVNIYYG